MPCRGRGSITYGLLATNTSTAVSCARPSRPMKRRSNGSASGPIKSGIMSITVRTLCSRYADDSHDRAVDPHRHVVHEGAAVDAAEIDAPLMPVDECVERADDVVAVDAEVSGEVIPGAGGNAHVRQIVLGRDRGDRSL